MENSKKELLKSVGFEKEIENVENGKCPFCGKPVNEKDFKDELSRKEFHLSGMCEKCQNDFFD